MTTILAVVSDLHTNSTVGLCPPGVQLDDGGTYRAGKTQRWLWSSWLNYWTQVTELQVQFQAPLWIVCNGDAFDGDHHDTYQVITRNPADMLHIAAQVFETLPKWEHLFIVRGTPAHVGKGASLEETLAADLSATGDTATGTASWWHLPLDCDGVLFDIAHHGTMGSLPWTKANAANKLAALTVFDYAGHGGKLPHVVIRSHRHEYADSGGNFPVLAIQSPAWQLPTEYTRRLAPAALGDIGGLVFVCHEGRYTWRAIRYRPQRRRFLRP